MKWETEKVCKDEQIEMFADSMKARPFALGQWSCPQDVSSGNWVPDWYTTTPSIAIDTSLRPLHNPPRQSQKNSSSLNPKQQKGEAANMLFSGSQALRPRLVTESQLSVLVGPQTLWERKLPLSLARSLTRGHYSREIRGCASTPEQRRQQLPTVPSAPLATPDPTFLTGGSPGAGGKDWREGDPWCCCESCFQRTRHPPQPKHQQLEPVPPYGVPHWTQRHARRSLREMRLASQWSCGLSLSL